MIKTSTPPLTVSRFITQAVSFIQLCLTETRNYVWIMYVCMYVDIRVYPRVLYHRLLEFAFGSRKEEDDEKDDSNGSNTETDSGRHQPMSAASSKYEFDNV